MTADFDPMLAKLVGMAPTATRRSRASVAALGELAVLGVQDQHRLSARVLDHPAFRAGELHTGFVSEHRAELAAERTAIPRRSTPC